MTNRSDTGFSDQFAIPYRLERRKFSVALAKTCRSCLLRVEDTIPWISITLQIEHSTAIFKITSSESRTFIRDIAEFSSAVASTIDENSDFKNYLCRLLTRIVQHCHGTLLAVAAPYENDPPRSVTAGVMTLPVVDLFQQYESAKKLQDADSLGDLRAYEILLEGMIASDGIVVFSTNGKILAYRAFIKADETEANRLPAEGGGRLRTFELMKLRMPTEYHAAFFRSQDGETRCEMVKI